MGLSYTNEIITIGKKVRELCSIYNVLLILNDRLDVVQIVDTSGAIKNTYDYDVWGNFLKKEETIDSRNNMDVS